MFQNRKVISSFLIVVLMLSFGTALFSVVKAYESAPYTDITVDQAYQMIKHTASNLVILDVRNQSEYDLGHLYNAILIPIYMLENRTMALQAPANNTINLNGTTLTIDNSPQLHINDRIIVYCKSGSRSAQASRILADHGFKRIYNMLGGIVAWMQAGYQIDTTYHYVSVDAFQGKSDIQIEPYLLYQATCPCSNQTRSSNVTPEPVTQTVLENGERHWVIALASKTNGTVLQTVDKTLLWSYNETTQELNRTITLVSTKITIGDESVQELGLYDYVYGKDYNLTLGTILAPLDSETYNRSVITIAYFPFEERSLATEEQVDFGTSVTLSQLFRSLGKVTNELKKTYAKNKDAKLKVLEKRYQTMADDANLLSEIVEKQMPEYNKIILNNTATIMNFNWCLICTPVCSALITVGCYAVCYFSSGAACVFCYYIGDPMKLGGCALLCSLCVPPGASTPPPGWVANVWAHGTMSGYGHAYDWDNIVGSAIDGKYATVYGGNLGDAAYIEGNMYCQVVDHGGEIYLYGYSATGYYSHVYVYAHNPYVNTWYYIKDLTVYYQDGVHSIDIGWWWPYIDLLTIVGYDDNGMSCNFKIDAVSVVP
jgi:rhodanese-related sulfurtransferase